MQKESRKSLQLTACGSGAQVTTQTWVAPEARWERSYGIRVLNVGSDAIPMQTVPETVNCRRPGWCHIEPPGEGKTHTFCDQSVVRSTMRWE